MEELILELLEDGDRVIFTFSNAHPLKATFIKCSHNCVVLRNKTGRLMVVRVEDIVRFQKVDADRRQFAKFTPAEEARCESPVPAAAPVVDEPAPTAADDLARDDDRVSLESVIGKTELFELGVPEVAPVKVVGKVNLDEIDRKRRRRVTRLEQPEPTGYATDDDDDDDEVDPDDDSALLPAMGYVSSIGPKFGFIDSAGENYYFNLNEVMLGGANDESLQKGDEVVFSPTTNKQGNVARAVHRPWTVNRQVRRIEKIMDKDIRNAALLSRQLVDAFPGDDTVSTELFAIGMKGY